MGHPCPVTNILEENRYEMNNLLYVLVNILVEVFMETCGFLVRVWDSKVQL